MTLYSVMLRSGLAHAEDPDDTLNFYLSKSELVVSGRIEPGLLGPIVEPKGVHTCAEIIGAKLPDNAAEESVSILPALLGTADEPLREATIHQAPNRDLAVRKGPWKLIFSGNKRELYHLGNDLGETTDVADSNPEVVTSLTALMQKYIDDGRSTAGAPQKNEAAMSINGRSGSAAKEKKGGKKDKAK